jgi:hypothetical protein
MVGKRVVSRAFGIVLLAGALALAAAPAARAQEHEMSEEMRAHLDKVHELLAHLEHAIGGLQELGWRDAEEHLTELARHIRREVEARFHAAEHGEREVMEHAAAARDELRHLTEREAKHLREIQSELATVEAEMEHLHRDVAMAERVVEMATKDLDELERGGERREMERVREVVRDYRERLGQGRHELESLHGHREELNRLQQRVEREVRNMLRELESLEREVAGAERNERVRAMRERSRERGRPRDEDRERIMHELEVMRSAMPALREGERLDMAELLERMMHAREMLLEHGRAVDQPTLGQQAEILRFAGHLWREFGHPDRAEPVERLAAEIWSAREREQPRRERAERRERRPREREGRGDRERRERRPGIDRERLAHEVEVMRVAMHAVLEAGHERAAGLLERAIQARLVRLEGMENEEARHALEREPNIANQVEVLRLAARIWRELGDAEKSEAVAQLAEGLWEGREHRQRERAEGRERGDERARVRARMEELERELERLREMLRRMGG